MKHLKTLQTIVELEKKHKVIFSANDVKVLLVLLSSLNNTYYNHIGNGYISEVSNISAEDVRKIISNFISMEIIEYDLDPNTYALLYKLNI